MWDINTGNYIFPQTWVAHTMSVNTIKMLSASTIVSGSNDNKLIVWNITSTPVAITVYNMHTAAVTGVDKLQNGNLVSVSDDRSIRIWNPATGATVDSRANAHGTTGTYNLTCVRALPSGSIATASKFGDIRIWTPTLSSFNALGTHTGMVNILELLSNGLLVSGGVDTFAVVWNTTTLTQKNKFKAVGGTSVTCIKELNDGAVVFGGNSPTLFTYRLNYITNTQISIHNGTNFLAAGELPCQGMNI